MKTLQTQVTQSGKHSLPTIRQEVLSQEPSAHPREYCRGLFREIVDGWVGIAWRHLLRAPQYRDGFLSERAFTGLKEALGERLQSVSQATLLREYERTGDRFSTGSERNRLMQFERWLFRNEARRAKFYRAYPALTQLLVTIIDQFVKNTVNFSNHLSGDYHQLCEVLAKGRHQFSVPRLPLEAHIQAGLSDPHQGGKTVLSIQFKNGPRVIYKPKDLSIAGRYNDLLEELNQLGLQPQLPVYQTLQRPGYGWVEAIEHKPCQTTEAVRRFFVRSGMNLCLMVFLQGADMHWENLIAAGEFPYFVDLETLFHHLDQISGVSRPSDKAMLEETLLLPTPVGGSLFGKRRPDCGGITGVWPPPTRNPHLCHLGDRVQEAGKFSQDLCAGFGLMYDHLLKHRHYLLTQSKAWQHLIRCPVRMVFRTTALYGKILRQLNRPEFMADPEKRKLQLKSYLEVGLKYRNSLRAIMASEIEALLKNDIPQFNFFPHRRHLYANGKAIARNFFSDEARAGVEARFRGFNPRDRERQLRDLRLALTYSVARDCHHPGKRGKPFTEQPSSMVPLFWEKDQCPISAYASELESRMLLPETDQVQWRDLEQDTYFKQSFLGFSGAGFASGSIGVGFFFASLFASTGNNRWRRMAERCCHPVMARIKQGRGHFYATEMGLGGFVGLGGILFGLAEIGRLLNQPYRIELAWEVASTLAPTVLPRTKIMDLFGGLAGWILCLLKLHQLYDQAPLMPMAQLCGDLLVANMEQAIEANRIQSSLGSFAFGLSGMSLALLKLGQKLECETLMTAGQNAVHRALGSIEDGVTSWCSGEAGILLCQVRLLPLITDPSLREKMSERILRGINRVQKSSVPEVDHLCCGNAGKLACLLACADLLKHGKLRKWVQSASLPMMQKGEADGHRFLAYFPEPFFRPGLLTGTAGIAQYLLALKFGPQHLDFLTLS